MGKTYRMLKKEKTNWIIPPGERYFVIIVITYAFLLDELYSKGLYRAAGVMPPGDLSRGSLLRDGTGWYCGKIPDIKPALPIRRRPLPKACHLIEEDPLPAQPRPKSFRFADI